MILILETFSDKNRKNRETRQTRQTYSISALPVIAFTCWA